MFVVVTGWVVLSGHTRVADPHANFRNAFQGSSKSGNDVSIRFLNYNFLPLISRQYATAMFKVIFSYGGWSNVNYVLNNVRNPVRTLKIAGPLGLGICTVLYLLANVAYFRSEFSSQM